MDPHASTAPRTLRPARIAATSLVLALAVLASLGTTHAQPATPVGLRVADVGEFSVNVTFGPSPTSGVQEYRLYVSDANGTTVDGLHVPAGVSTIFGKVYDQVFTTAPANVSRLQPATYRPFWFRNATTSDWTLGYESNYTKYVPSDFTALAYRFTGLAANETVWLAVTAVGPGGDENPSVSPVPAVPLAQALPEKPRNEGIYLTWALILVVVLLAIVWLSRHESRRNRRAYLYILPPLLGLAALTFYPVAFGFYISFTDRIGEQTPSFDLIGLANYARVFVQPDFVMVATTTLVWTVVNVVLHVSIGLFLAVLLNRRIRGRVTYRALLLLPWAVPSYITTLAWRGMFETHQGLVNALIGPLGWQLLGCNGACQWLTATNSPLPLIAVIVTNVWLGFPFMMMVFSGALQGIPVELYEAADVDGLSGWQKFRHITVPLLKPAIVPASLLGFIWTFNMFNVIYLMTAGRPPVPGMRAGVTDILITYVYRVGFQPPFEQGFAAAYSVVIFFMLLGFGLFYSRYTGAMESLSGGPAPTPRVKRAAPRSIGAHLRRLRCFWSVRVSSPTRTAMGSDQPEHIQVPTPLILALAAFGIFELYYGVRAYQSMPFWFIVDIVRAAWFFLVGLGLVLGAAGLALRQRAGRRLVAWTLVLQLLGSLLVFLGSPGNLVNLQVLAGAALLALVVRLATEYTVDPDPWTAFLDRVRTVVPRSEVSLARRSRSNRWTNIAAHVILIPFTLLTILPILVVAGTAFGKFPAMALQNVPFLRDVLLPGQALPGWTLDNFANIFYESRFFLWLRNSILVSAGTTAVGLLLATTGAYGFSRFEFRGKRGSMLSFIVVQMFPGAIILIPYYVLMYQLGLINSLISLVIMYSVTALPFVLWFLKGFFDTIPVDLEEAAMVDGTTRTGALWRIIIPLAKPAIAVAALFSFLAAWNEWLLAFTFMTSSDNYTLPVGVSSFVNPPQVFWNEFAAISILVSLPVAVLFIVFQKYLVSGLTKGAVKG
ncbi:MAG: ABC transporter permease subunit [Thermoplasmata archaeon]